MQAGVIGFSRGKIWSDFSSFVEESKQLKRTAWLRCVREWARKRAEEND